MVRFLALLLVLVAATPLAAEPADPFARLKALKPHEQEDVLWLARCVLSESNRADEQRYVAWVVRNRVETGYRGTSYREVVLEPYQFSAFNEPSERRRYLTGLGENTRGDKAWRSVLGIALDVYAAPASERPFSIETRHFYSPVSMPGKSTPRWAKGRAPVALATHIDDDRFRFYENVDYAADAPLGSREALAEGDTPTVTRRGGSLAERFEARRARFKTSIRRPQRPTSPAAARTGSR